MIKSVLIVVGLVSFFVCGSVHAEYLAYAINEDGEKRPLPEVVDNIEADEILNIEWGDYSGNTVRVGVLNVQNESKVTTVNIGGTNFSYSVDTGSKGVPVEGIEAILTDVMLHSGRFRMVERKELDSTIKEQDLGASGRVSKPSAAKIGKILGAEYLIKAVVTEYEPDFKGSSWGLGGLGSALGSKVGILGGVGVSNKKGMVSMNFRIIDATTTEVLYSKQVQAVISKSGLTFGGAGFGGGGALGGFLSNYSKTPIGQAVIACVNKGVFELVKQIGTAPLSGEVVKVSGKKIYLNLGKGVVEKGDMLTIMAKGEDLIDPKTGLSLGAEEEEVGVVKVTSVKDKYSIAKSVDADLSEVSVGDKVVSEKESAPLKFAPPWEGSSSSGDSGQDDVDDVLGE